MFKCWWRVCHFMFLKVHFSSTRPPDALTWSPEGARLAAAQWETGLRWWHHSVCHSIGRGRVRNMTRLVHLHWTSTSGHVPGSIRERARKTKKSIFNPSDGSDTRDVTCNFPLFSFESYHEYRQVHVRCEVTSSSAIPLALLFPFWFVEHTSASQYGTVGLVTLEYSLTSVGRLNLNLSVAKRISQYC